MPSSACDLMGILLEWITLCGVVNRDIHDPPTDNECSIPQQILQYRCIRGSTQRTLSVDKLMHNIVLLRDDVVRDKGRWKMESCQGFFSLRSDWWQNSAEACTLHRAPSPLNYCRNHFFTSVPPQCSLTSFSLAWFRPEIFLLPKDTHAICINTMENLPQNILSCSKT